MRVAVVGSGSSWREAPFDDASVQVWGLNDGYRLGLPRFDAWLECHPLDRLFLTDEPTAPWEIPHGWFLRPTGHLAWLAHLTVPLWVQAPPPAWPHARRYPVEDVRATFRNYVTSGPGLAVALAILRGATWIGVYGCNLTGDGEYAYQRPNMEWLLGVAEGRGVTVEVARGSSLLRSSHLYAFEPPPSLTPSEEAAKERDRLMEARERELAALSRSRLARLLVPGLRRSLDLYHQAKDAHARAIALDDARRFGASRTRGGA